MIDVGEAKPSMKEDLEEVSEKTGISAIHIDADLDNMDKAFIKLGELMGEKEQAEKLAAYINDAKDLANETLKKAGKKKKVLYCTQPDGLSVLAKDSYHSQIIDMMADNVAVIKNAASKGTGSEVNIEQIMKWDPEIIIFAPDSYYDQAADDPSWKTLDAIKSGKYYEVPQGPYNWMGMPPASNRILGLMWITKLLYPDESDIDMKGKTKEYYDLFYHYDLSDEEYDELIKNSISK
jgi:iron complex transport system substrate-binding protein